MNCASLQGVAAEGLNLSDLKIAYLVSQYPATTHTFILREIKRLRELGADVRVISIAGPDRLPAKMTPEELEQYQTTFYVKPLGIAGAVREHAAMLATRPANFLKGLLYACVLGRINLPKTVANLLYFTEAVIAGRWMEKQRITHAHIHFSSTVGLLITHMFDITTSVTMHGPDEFADPAGFYLRHKIQRSLFVCAISYFSKSQLMKASEFRYWEKFEVCPLGVDPSIFVPRPFHGGKRRFEILCVGRLAPAKGQHILVCAIRRLIDAGRDVYLRLVGEGPDRASLTEQVETLGLSKVVQIDGALNQDQLLKIYEGTDLFALASFAEGVPVVLMEAMSMEIPCVATRIAGIPELIREGIDGLLVAPGDEKAFAQAIGQLLDNPDLREKIGKSGRQRIVEHYHLAKNVDHLAKIFQRRLNR